MSRNRLAITGETISYSGDGVTLVYDFTNDDGLDFGHIVRADGSSGRQLPLVSILAHGYWTAKPKNETVEVLRNTQKMLQGLIEDKADRRVRDSDYWGAPVGTPIVPGMNPSGQIPLPGMPKPIRTVSALGDSARAERRERSTVGYAREQGEEIQSLLRFARIDSSWESEPVRTLWNKYKVTIEDTNFVEADDYPLAFSYDWVQFGGCREIREAAYDILGYDIKDEMENIADPYLLSPVNPRDSSTERNARAPYGHAYVMLEDLNSAPRAEIPLWRGVQLRGISTKRFIEDLKKEKTFDLPLASFTGSRVSAEYFGDDVIFRIATGARAMIGGPMGDSENEDEQYLPKHSEMVTGGRFEITNIRRDSKGRQIISIRQIATFNPDTGLATKMANRRWKYAYLFDNSVRATKGSTTNAEEVIKQTRKMLQDVLEGKAARRVRKVATPEGERHFGQPINSVIIADTPLTNIRVVDSEFNEYDKYLGADGQKYYVFQDVDIDKTWYAIDESDEVLLFADTEVDLLIAMDKKSRHPLAKPYRGVRDAPEGFHAADIEERVALKVPPAWVDVFINDDKNAALKAFGYDGADRKQPLYTAKHMRDQADKKYIHIKSMHRYMPALDRAIKEDWKTNDDAKVLMLIRKIGMRPGSTSNTRAVKQAFGATTLEARHIRLNKDSVTFIFTGKKGVQISLNSKDPDIVEMMRSQMQGKSRSDLVFPNSNSITVASYLKSKTSDKVKLKDLRTYRANEIALAELKKIKRKPKTEAEFKRMRNAIGDSVASILGNSRTMSLNSYINPAVFYAIAEEPEWLEKIISKQRKEDD